MSTGTAVHFISSEQNVYFTRNSERMCSSSPKGWLLILDEDTPHSWRGYSSFSFHSNNAHASWRSCLAPRIRTFRFWFASQDGTTGILGSRGTSASFLAELSVCSPRKLFIFIILKKYFLDQNIQKLFYLILKKEALRGTWACYFFAGEGQRFLFSRNIGYLTPKLIYFHYLSGSKYPKNI